MSEIKVTEELLEGGEFLDMAIGVFNRNPNKENLEKLLLLVRSSKFWIPCKISLSDRDQHKVNILVDAIADNMGAPVKGSFKNEDSLHYVPDLVKNGEDFFMPIFTSKDHMEKYSTGFVTIEKDILEIIEVAKNNDLDLRGIVVNPSKESFIITKELWPTFAKINPLF